MCQAVTFNLSHRTAAAGPGFSSYFCFDWGLIVTRLELGVHSKQQRRHFTEQKSADHMFTISIGSGEDWRLCVCLWGLGQSFPLTSSHWITCRILFLSPVWTDVMCLIVQSVTLVDVETVSKGWGLRWGAVGLSRKSMHSRSTPWARQTEKIQD